MRYAIFFLTASLWCQQDVIRTSSNEVLVDVVVRDKKGKLVSGLQAGDFTVLEDGIAQTITSVREIRGGLAAGGPADATRPVRLISLVFDRLAIDSRRIARTAAGDLLKADLAPNVYIAVFASDLHLRVVQPFTNNRELLKQAVERATGGRAMTNYADANSAMKLALDSTKGSEGAAAKASGGPQGANVDVAGMAQEAMAAMVRDMLEFAETSVQEQQGRSSLYALWAIVKEQSRLPGRKTVLFFSEGLQVPTSLAGNFRSMISSANRANVSVYSIDSRGLSTGDDSAAAREALATSLSVSQRQYRNTENSAVTRVDANQFDRAMDSIRANPQVNLQELAESTGGVLIANMNDFRKPLERVTEELSTYYEVTYQPRNTVLDGSFRAITTKLSRGDLQVQSRSGYFALPVLKGATVLPFEVPLLKSLGSTPVPRGIDFRSSVWLDKASAHRYDATIVFEMPLRGIVLRELDSNSYRAHVSFLALVKDASGQVFGKISNDIPVNLPKDKLDGFRSGSVFFTRPISLPAGRYTLEAAASDLEGAQIAARRTAIVVPEAKSGALGLSMITLVRRLEDAPPGSPDAFTAGPKRVVPTLQDRIPIGPRTALSLFFNIHSVVNAGPVEATIVLELDGKALGGAKVDVPPPDAAGRIPYIATIPLDGFQPGLYEVKVTARQGVESVTRSLFVTMEANVSQP